MSKDSPSTKVAEATVPPTFEQADWDALTSTQQCPFLNRKCLKNRKSEPELTIGTCTMTYGRKPPVPVMICPFRLLERSRFLLTASISSAFTSQVTNYESSPNLQYPAAASIIVLCPFVTVSQGTSSALNSRRLTPRAPCGPNDSDSSKSMELMSRPIMQPHRNPLA